MQEKMRRLVEALDKTHNEYVSSIHTFGKVTPIATQKASDYKVLQREIVKVDNDKIIDTNKL